LPLIVSGGGNSGSQASTLIIRAMALGEIRGRDWWLVMRREVLMGCALGALLGSIAACRVMVWGAAGAYSHDPAGQHVFLVGLTVAIAVTGCVAWGTISGAMLPFLLKKIGADPASASAPLVATIVDVSGIAIYLTVASLILSGVLL
jgi:magnesium transporter